MFLKHRFRNHQPVPFSLCFMAAMAFVLSHALAVPAHPLPIEKTEAEQEVSTSLVETAEEARDTAEGEAGRAIQVLLMVGLGLGLGGTVALLAAGSRGDGGAELSWSHQRAQPYNGDVAAQYLSGGIHRAELMALSETRTDARLGYNPYLLVNAPTAYGHGATGLGKIIAILDDGFQLDHPALESKIEGVYQRDDMPVNLHGTHVASLAAGARDGSGMFGLAFDARLHLASHQDESGALGFSPTHWANATEAARQAGAVVQNNSWGLEGYGQERVRSDDVNRVVADPTAIDSLAPDVRADLTNFLIDHELNREILRGDPAATLALFVQALVLSTASHQWLPEDWQRYVDALNRFQETGVVTFALSNNHELTFGDVSAVLPEIFSELADAWIAVANVDLYYADPDDPGNSALYARRMSAPCAQSAAYCLSHDGTQVLGAVPIDGYNPLTGTSMAAPQVAGAVALLAQAFPGHTPEQLTARLLAAAHNFDGWQGLTQQADGKLVGRLGDHTVILAEAPGTIGEAAFGDGVIHAHSSVYGHGFMDLGAAMQPIGGTPRFAVGGNLSTASYFGLTESRVSLGPAFGDGLARGLAGIQVMTFDRLGGGFTFPLDRMVNAHPFIPQAGDLLTDFARGPDRYVFHLGRDVRLTMALRADASARFHSEPNDHRLADPELRIILPFAQGLGFTAWNNSDAALGFGLQTSGWMEEELLPGYGAFTNPYLDFAAQGQGGTLQFGLVGAADLRIGVFEGRHRENRFFGEVQRSKARVSGTAVELNLPLGTEGHWGGIDFTGGLLYESDTFLGAETSGAFALAGGTPTFFTSFSGRLALDPIGLGGFSLIGAANWGWTRPQPAPASLFSDISTIASESFTLGLQVRSLLDPRDRFTLTFHQPLRVRSGSARMELPVGRNPDLDMQYQVVAAELVPSGRETALEAAYGLRLNRSTDLACAVIFRRHPGHQRTAADEAIGLVKMQVRF